MKAINESKRTTVLNRGAAMAFVAYIVVASGAMAQEATQKPDPAAQKPVTNVQVQQQAELTPVTGSHIRRVPRPETTLPLMELDRTYIDRSGATNPRELIRTVPAAQVR